MLSLSPSACDSPPDRGQSDVLGTILLVGITVIVITATGVFLLPSILEQVEDDQPIREFNVSTDGTNLTVQHAGGESIAPGAVTVVINGSDRRPLTEANLTDLSDGRFDPGETAVYEGISIRANTEVAVVNTDRDVVITRETLNP